MRHCSGKTLLAFTLFFSLHPFAVVQAGVTSAAKAGPSGGDERRPKGLLHPVAANSDDKTDKGKAVLHAGRGGAGNSKEKNRLAKEIDAILGHPSLDRAHWGLDAVDLESGKALYARNPDKLFLPASNAKLFTTAAALAIAGAEYRFRTTVEAEGKIDNQGQLTGDLVIVGRGDPNISGRTLPYTLKTQRTPPHTQILEDMADQVARSGLKIVEGDLIGDDTYYAFERYAEGWAQDDLQWIDGAPVSALTFNDNVIFMNIQPGGQAGDKALITMEPENSYYELDNRIVTTPAGGTKKIGIHREPGAKKLVLWGSLPVGDAGMKEPLAIDDPAEFVAQLFRTLLERRGIVVRGKARARHADAAQFFDQAAASLTQPAPAAASATSAAAAAGQSAAAQRSCCGNPPGNTAAENNAAQSSSTQVLAEHVSLPFLEDIRVINKTSENLHAELALRLVGKLSGAGGSFEGGSAAVKQFLLKAGVKEDEFIFLDGSGLSRRDLVTPAATVQLLLFAARQPWGAALEESLPVSGVDGSLADRFVNTPAGGLVHAKTGSLSHVNALSGYGETKSGKRFVFSIFCNNHDMPAGKVLSAIDSVVQLLVTEGAPRKK